MHLRRRGTPQRKLFAPELYARKMGPTPAYPPTSAEPEAPRTTGPSILMTIPSLDMWKYKATVTDVLRHALSACGIRTLVHTDPTEDVLAQHDMVLMWSHGWEGNADQDDYCQRVSRIGHMAKVHGKPVFSAIPDAVGHDQCYDAWDEASIRCPKHADVDHAASLGFPLILRVKHKMSCGRQMFLAKDAGTVSGLSKMYPDLDLAVEFIDVRSPDGYYRKYRSYIVGNAVVPRQVMTSTDWCVSLAKTVGVECPTLVAENHQFLKGNHPWDPILLAAAKAIGTDMGAIDYSFTPEGNIVIWEINACFGMAGEGDTAKDQAFRSAMGFTVDDVIHRQQQLGLVMVRELLLRCYGVSYDSIVPILWTGGYDSTFRLCQLLDTAKTVLPVYICSKIDNRRSVRKEIATMQRLAPLLKERFPQGRLLPTLMVGEPGGPLVSTALPGDAEVTAMARAIGYGNIGRERMGAQYEPLCRFARHFGVMEIGIEIGGRAEKLLRDSIVEVAGEYVLTEDLKERNLEIFRPFKFPLIRMTKAMMAEEAESRGYSAILASTWTCWAPRPGGQPCGRCEMCRRREHEIPS